MGGLPHCEEAPFFYHASNRLYERCLLCIPRTIANTYVEANAVVLTTLFRALLKYAPETTTDSVYELTLPVMEGRGTNDPLTGMFIGHVLNTMIDDKDRR